MLFHESSRSVARRVLLPLALAFLWMSAVLSAEDAPKTVVAGIRTVGPDVEVFLAGPPPPGVSASVVLVDAGGNTVARGSVEVVDGEARAVLAGALASVAAHGPSYRVLVMDGAGRILGDDFPFLVALRCPGGEPCHFQLLPGLAAKGTAVVDPALGRALDVLPAGTVDQLAAAVAVDPSLRGAALTAAWHWAALPQAPAGVCGCVWTLEPSLPGGTSDGGLAAGVTARAVSGEDGVRVEQARAASLALRQRCVRTEIHSTEPVTVVAEQGPWSTVVAVPRVVLSGCPTSCASAVSWEMEVEGEAVARAEGGPEASAAASWEIEGDVDGAVVLRMEDGASTVSDPAGSVASRRTRWAGSGTLAALRASVRAEMAAPGEPADAEAIAAAAWRLAGRGVSSCAWPGQVGVSVVSKSRIHHVFPDVPGLPCDPGQIGLLIGNGRLCQPRTRRK